MNGDNMSNPLEGFTASNRPKMPLSQKAWTVAFALFLGAVFGLLAQHWLSNRQLAQPVQPAAGPQPLGPGRNTFSSQTSDLIARYNKIMKEIEPTLALPSADRFSRAGNNAQFQSLAYEASPQITIVFEVDNISKKPFSIGFIGHLESPQKIGDLLGVMAAVGATAFGKGNDAGAVARVCAAAADAREKSSTLRLEDLDVFCAVAEGVWIGGVSVPKNLPASSKS